MKLKDIDREVNLLRQKYLNSPPPFNPFILGKKLGIDIFSFPFPDEISGLLVIMKGKPYIGVNSNQNDLRKRFTTAHEIGHFVLHKASFYLCGNKSEEKEEIEANYFASELLLPAELILREDSFIESRYEKFVSRFRAPIEIIKDRVKFLNIDYSEPISGE